MFARISRPWEYEHGLQGAHPTPLLYQQRNVLTDDTKCNLPRLSLRASTLTSAGVMDFCDPMHTRRNILTNPRSLARNRQSRLYFHLSRFSDFGLLTAHSFPSILLSFFLFFSPLILIVSSVPSSVFYYVFLFLSLCFLTSFFVPSLFLFFYSFHVICFVPYPFVSFRPFRFLSLP